MVRVEGLEPPRREALDPKSSMSTNFITPALLLKSVQTTLLAWLLIESLFVFKENNNLINYRAAKIRFYFLKASIYFEI